MKSLERRDNIVKSLKEVDSPIKGTVLADKFGVTRQIIVKDIAILRAKGFNIIATPEGYMFNNITNRIKSIIAVKHLPEETFEELKIIIKYGGIVEDVIVEHPLYGEIKGNLMIKNLNDLNEFITKFLSEKIRPLSDLTSGVHLHTISVENDEDMNLINKELKSRGFIL